MASERWQAIELQMVPVYRSRYDWRAYEMQDAIDAGCGCWRPN